MYELKLEEVLNVTEGKWLHKPSLLHSTVQGISNDTRNLQAHDLYIALTGEHFDGHQFLPQAQEAGALCALVQKSTPPPPENFPAILVPDTLYAMGELAQYQRKKFENLKLLAIGGSNGKTTTRTMLHAILDHCFPSLQNQKNHNNLIGVPQTLFQLKEHHRFAVVEIGTSLPGEIQRLTEIVSPDLGILTNISEEHLEGLGSIEGVIEEEAKLLEGLGSQGIAIINFDDPHSLCARKKATGRVVSYGFDKRCEIRASSFQNTSKGSRFLLNERYTFEIPFFGRHNVSNALAAIAAAWTQEIPIEAMQNALATIQPLPGRLEPFEVNGKIILNDTYNANPASMRASLKVLNDYQAQRYRIICLGDMFELGKEAESAHSILGWFIGATKQIDLMVAVGPLMHICGKRVEEFGIPVWYYEDASSAAAALVQEMETDDVLLVKGSRSMQMEKVVEAFLNSFSSSKAKPS